MTPRPLSRPQPIPFGQVAPSRPAPAPMRSPVRFDAAPQRHAPAPIPWGQSAAPLPPAATAIQAEDPRALYEVARRWQGQSVPTAMVSGSADAPAVSTATRRPAISASPTGDTHARYVGQGSLCVRSSVTGRHYRFSRHGDTLRIDKHDMTLMRRIADIELS